MSEHIHPAVARHLEQVRALARDYGVARLELFGSAATTSFDEARSDVDFLVEYPAGYDFGLWATRFQELEEDLAGLLGRNVHLVMTSALKNPRFAAEAARTRTVILNERTIADTARVVLDYAWVQRSATCFGIESWVLVTSQQHPGKQPPW